jgi:hypothetical protein
MHKTDIETGWCWVCLRRGLGYDVVSTMDPVCHRIWSCNGTIREFEYICLIVGPPLYVVHRQLWIHVINSIELLRALPNHEGRKG